MSPLAELGDLFRRCHRQRNGFLDGLQDILRGELPVLGKGPVHGGENCLLDFSAAELVGLLRQPRDIIFFRVALFQAEVNLKNNFPFVRRGHPQRASALGRFLPFSTLPPQQQLSGAKQTLDKKTRQAKSHWQLLRI